MVTMMVMVTIMAMVTMVAMMATPSPPPPTTLDRGRVPRRRAAHTRYQLVIRSAGMVMMIRLAGLVIRSAKMVKVQA